MAKYLIKTVRINDNVKSGVQATESNWLYIDSEITHTIDIFGKKFIDEAEPVKHAHVFVDEDGNMWCSNCGSSNCFDNYCGYCGAKMDGMETEDEQ